MEDITMAMIEAGRKFSDGHFTLLAFTTHWKATFSTPINDGGYPNEIQDFIACETPDEAVKAAFCNLMKQVYEKKIKRKFDPLLSKKLDCIMFLLES